MPRLLVVFLWVFATLPALAAEQPNIVVIMCDDMGFSDVGCYGSEIDTPNIDRLAAEGMRFTQFYNNAKCTISRASLMTGVYPRQGDKLLLPQMRTIPEVLAEGGYFSALAGKWHLGSEAPYRPSDRGFNTYYGLLDGCCNYHDPSRADPDFKGGRVRWFGENDRRITEFPKDFYTTDAFTDAACRSIDEAVQRKQPLFLHVAYTAPHYPLHAPPELIEKYRGRYRAGWDQVREARLARQIEQGVIDPRWKSPEREPEAPAWDVVSNQDYQDHLMAVYAAMIDRMDQGVGRILSKLEEHGLAENTVVLFLADNGGCAGSPGGEANQAIPGGVDSYTGCGPGWAYAQNTPFRRFKTWMHEGGISTPFIVRWPGQVPAGTLCHQVGHLIDLLPTFADLAGIDVNQNEQETGKLPIEGVSLRALLTGENTEVHDTLFWGFAGNRAIREGQWKLCWDRNQMRWELYEIQEDRTETNDLSASHPERVAAMSARWLDWAARMGVPLEAKQKLGKLE
ncbi:arylsulfatase [Planctomicrobium sp. SH661]|uniref:arylsulfatase n=1 Tax=Planctomicrobium sp. SH661 TaxID=3448124 RepID=UPI003F5B62E2